MELSVFIKQICFSISVSIYVIHIISVEKRKTILFAKSGQCICKITATKNSTLYPNLTISKQTKTTSVINQSKESFQDIRKKHILNIHSKTIILLVLTNKSQTTFKRRGPLSPSVIFFRNMNSTTHRLYFIRAEKPDKTVNQSILFQPLQMNGHLLRRKRIISNNEIQGNRKLFHNLRRKQIAGVQIK